MAERVTAGTTSHTVDLFLQDSSSATGDGLTGLVHNTSGLTAYYRKGGTGASTAITLATQTATGAWTSGGFAEIDATNMPGVYRLDVPNAVIDSAGYATVYFRGATNLLQTSLRIDCAPVPSAVQSIKTDAVDADALASDAVAEIQSGLSTLDAAGVRSAVGLASADLDTQLSDLPTVAEFEARTLVASAYFDAGADTVTVGANQDKTGYSLTVGTGLGNQTADITGNLSGAVGSISGVTFPTNFSALGINSSGHLLRVATCDTTTANTDMRGTNGAALASEWTATRAGHLDSVLLAQNSNQRTVQVTGSNHIAADVHEFQDDALTSAATDATFIAAVQSGLATSAALATVDSLVDLLVSRSGYQMSILAGAISNAQDAAEAYSITLDGSTYSVTYSGLDSSGNRSGATLVTT